MLTRSRSPRASRYRPAVLIAGLTAATVLPLTGCGSPTSSTPEPAPASPTVPVPTPTTYVEPADGPRIVTEGAYIHGLKGMHRTSDFGALQGWRDDQVHITLIRGYGADPSLDTFARSELRILRERLPKVKRVEDVVIGGGKYNAFHLVDSSDPTEENHVYGSMFLNGSWLIFIGFYNDEVGDSHVLTPEEREETTARILASFTPTYNR